MQHTASSQTEPHHTNDAAQTDQKRADLKPYIRLLVSLTISYVVMFAVMFSRVDVIDNVFLSLNQVYMTALMTAPMLIIMLVVMNPMYKLKKLNVALIVGAIVAIGLTWGLLRTQTGVGDKQFLQSMIPHHAAAILVCDEAALTDERIIELCGEIVEAQEREISEMKAIMQDYE